MQKSRNVVLTTLLLLTLILFTGSSLKAQKLNIPAIKKQIEAYKNDSRGPYYRIKWFCDDGSILDPKQSCPNGGIQHASYKADVVKLGKEHHIFLGNLLVANKPKEFWDAENNHSRLKQYQIVKYLTNVDNGWIYRKGQFYRGAMQAEDEAEWGKKFFLDLLKDRSVTDKNYYLVRQALRDIPHMGDSNSSQLIRSQSKVLAEEIPSFMNIRIKIHGNPDKSDIKTVQNFVKKHQSSITSAQKAKLNELIKTMEAYYKPVSASDLTKKVNAVKDGKNMKAHLTRTLNQYSKAVNSSEKVQYLTDILTTIRLDMGSIHNAADRMHLLDLSNQIERSLFIESQQWKPKNLKELIQKIKILSYAAMGTGMIELWEWEQVMDELADSGLPASLTLKELNDLQVRSRGIVEWSTAMTKAVYEDDVKRFAAFEPKALQFLDDRVRSSIVLDLGESVSALGKIITKHSAIENKVLDIPNAANIRGLNPGYAFGELVVVRGSKNVEFEKDKIYVFERPTADLKPIAGIMTISEGNLVSHVQLLARNLGIPNAALSSENLNSLAKYNGKKVFYAVSDKGNVIMKLAKDMTPTEKALFSKQQRNTNKVHVPVDRIKLDQTHVLNLRDVKADDSGKICGPKAANLGQLKSLFPDHVVEGFVIPFGIFRKHLDNPMPGTGMTYWKYLNETYAQADKLRKAHKSEQEVDDYQVKRLTTLRKAIEKMELNADFKAELEKEFKKVFGSPIGTVPVFLRSDTNMEDLKEFTGAGLNLTLFNVLSKEKIYNGIKEVWASPYTDRSLRWRQKYLLNPEFVFPSIVVIPGVNNDYSGVVITTGINEGAKDDITAAFSRGVGGAVEGQSAETRLITKNGFKLLAPSREPSYMTLPKTGGVKIKYTTFEKPILNRQNLQSIRDIVKEVRVKVPKNTDPDYKGAYDMEMGFKNNKLWLFQIRPFVENKKAKNSAYLKSIAPKIDYGKKISLTSKI